MGASPGRLASNLSLRNATGRPHETSSGIIISDSLGGGPVGGARKGTGQRGCPSTSQERDETGAANPRRYLRTPTARKMAISPTAPTNEIIRAH